MKILAIDPSINTCGYAIFEGKNLKEHGLLKPKSGSKNYIEKARDIAIQIHIKAESNFVDKLVVEKPMVFKSFRGYAATESEAAQKLYLCVGLILGRVSWKIKQALIPVIKWKGQLPKEVTVKRVNSKYGTNYNAHDKTNNIADAIGLGDWYITERGDK